MHRIAFAIAAILCLFIASPVWAQGEILITQAKALAGNVTPGDAAGYPITLSQPAAYIFGSSLTVPSGQIGLYVTSHNVDIDMNGFRLAGGGVATYGVVSTYGESRIHHGGINTFRYAGIYIRNNAWIIEDMQIVRNGGIGIDANNARFITVIDSLVAANSGEGIATGDNGIFRDSTFSGNGTYGIYCKYACHAEGNLVDGNIRGVFFYSGTVLGNTLSRNQFHAVIDGAGIADTGISQNMFIDNNSVGTSQTSFTVSIHPNTCIGKPC